jgi:DNA-binding response OmpR family regulator
LMARGRVVIVDDEESIRILCRLNLELEDYEVLEAADGETGVSIARATKPDVIFLDVMMPVMDGWEALVRLKGDDATADIPVVMLTARVSEADEIMAWGAGVLEYIHKPFDPDVLLECVSEAMKPRDPQVEAERRQRLVEELRVADHFRRRR